MSIAAPTVTPSFLLLQKEQVVVIEFRREIPKNSFLTLDLYYEGESSRFSTLPTALLGPRTVRAMFPVFPKPGIVNITVLLARNEDSCFPRFQLKVLSPIEALANSLPPSRGSRQAAMLAAAVAYLANCDEKDKEATMNADETISEILKDIQPAELPEWILAWLLCGKFSPAENLLHVCARQRLTQSLDILLQPWFIEERAHYLLQKGPDNKTPMEIAKKHGLVAMTEAAEQLSASGIMKLSTPKSKKKFNKKHDIPRASSIDSNLHYCAQESPTSPLKKKEKSKGAKRMLRQLFKSETKEKINIPAPQQPPVEELPFGGSSEDMRSATLPQSQRNSIASTSAISIPDPGSAAMSSVYSMAGKDESTYEQKRLSRTLPRIEQLTASPKPLEHPSLTPPPSARQSMHVPGQLQVTEHRTRPVSSLSSGYGSAVSNAVAELKEKAIYKAEVVRQYKSTNTDLVLEIGDKVYVTQENEDNMCAGICNDHYCKFPKSILCILSGDDVDDLEDEHDYDRVSFTGVSDDDDEVYKIPRNVPRIASSDSDSDGSDHIYDVPPNRDDVLNKLITEGHYMKVPTRNTILESLLSGSTQLGEDRSTMPQTIGNQQQLRGKEKIETTPVIRSRESPHDISNGTEQRQKERVTEVYVPDESEKVDTDGIYDVPSSVLRSIDDTVQGSEIGEDCRTLPQSTGNQQKLRGKGEIHVKTTPVIRSREAPHDVSNRTEQRQKERVTEIYVPDESEKVDTDGIYDVPSSVLRSNHDTEEQGSEYDQLIPISKHNAKITDESQRTLPGQSGWGYAEIKDVGLSALTATSQEPSHQDNTHSMTKLQYADITDAVPSKQAPFIRQLPNFDNTPDTDSTIDVHGSLVASLTPGSWGGPMIRESNEERVVQASVIDSENVQHLERETPTSSICQELEQSLEVSEPEDGRNMVTPEGSEGSDVFIDQQPVAMTTKSNSLPPRVSHRTQSAGGGNAMSPQRGISVKTPSPRHNRPRIVSEPQPTTKPKPAKRTRVSHDPPPQVLPQNTHLQLSEIQSPADVWASEPETPPPALPEKPQPPPALPEKPLPVLPEKPIPMFPDELAPALPEKPLPALPEKPPPELPEKPLPVPPLPEKPPPVLGEKPPPALPEKPVWEKPPAPAPPLEQSPNVFGSPVVGKSPPKPSERPPVPRPRRNFPSVSTNSPIQVRSMRSHTTASCNTAGLDSVSIPPSTHQSQEAIQGSPKAFRSTRAKSSSDSHTLGTSNGSGVHGRSPQHSPGETTRTVAYENAIFFKAKAAPPVARKPKHTPTSSPGPAFNRREHSGPPTTPKPKRN